MSSKATKTDDRERASGVQAFGKDLPGIDSRALVERAGLLRRQNEALFADSRRAQEQIERTRVQLSTVFREFGSDRRFRLAALNLIDDVAAARRGRDEEAHEREIAQDDARASAERYRMLFESMSEGFAVLDPFVDASGNACDYLIAECNPAFARQTGGEDACGRSIVAVLHEDGADALRQYERVRRTGEPADFEVYVAAFDRWLNVSATRIGPREHPRIAVVISDITRRKVAEQALRRSEDRLRTLSDVVPQLIWTNDAQGRADYFNHRWYEYSGLSFQASAGRGWEALVHPDDAAAATAAWQRALAAGDEFETEYRLRHAGGEYRWFIGRNIPFRDETGRVTSWFGSATDIHDLKLAEATVRVSEEQLRRAIEDAPIPVIMQAEDGEVLQISRTWTALTGYTREEMPTFDAWLTRAYGQGADTVREHVRRLFEGQAATLETELDVTTRSGAVRRWAFSASAPGSLSGGRRFIVGMALDITGRKRAEEALRASQERLRLIVENAREYAIFSLDLARRITSWNSGAQRITGYAAEDVLGKVADFIFMPEDVAAGVPEREAATTITRDRASDERWHLRKDGTRFWGSGVMMAMRDGGGEAVGLLKIFRDQTTELLAKETLEQSRIRLLDALEETERARADAESANRAKDHFFAVLSHELRTPLTPVMFATDLLGLRSDLPQEVQDALAMIRRNVELEARFVDDLLEVTKVTRGKLELLREPMDMHAAIAQALEVVKPDLVARKQHLAVALDAPAHEVDGDFARLQQVMWNLLKNASKFTPQGGDVRVATRNEPGHIIVEVSDTGIGIDAEELRHIFEPFTQANASITRKFGGLGLGLAIAKASVAGHGGELRAQSEGRDRGAMFTMSLPLREPK